MLSGSGCMLLLLASAAAGEGLGLTTPSGGAGVHRTLAAYGVAPGRLVLGATSEYFVSDDLLVDGDRHQRRSLRISAAWAPTAWLELAGGYGFVLHDNRGFDQSQSVSLGDPSLTFKVGWPLGDHVRLGGAASLLVPTSAAGRGLAPEAAVTTLVALATWRASPWLELSANLGYALDRSRRLFERRPDAATRFTAQVADVDQAVAALGAQTRFATGDDTAVAPFLELTGSFGTGAPLRHDPLWASLGTKLSLWSGALELAAGADVRLSGAPAATSELPGLPPWQAFLRIGAHLGGDDAAPERARPGLEIPAGNFVMRGTVIDQRTQQPVRDAVLTIAGYEDVRIAADGEGRFNSWPIPASQGLLVVRASAPDYEAGEMHVSRDAPGRQVEVLLALRSRDDTLPSAVTGSVKDAATGRALRAEILLTSDGKKRTTDELGRFSLRVKRGEHTLLISAPGYQTQKKEFRVVPGETIIFNIDLAR